MPPGMRPVRDPELRRAARSCGRNGSESRERAVAMAMTRPSRLRLRSSSLISFEVWVSRALADSSTKMSGGSLTETLAMATRPCSSQLVMAGRWWGRLASPTRSNTALARHRLSATGNCDHRRPPGAFGVRRLPLSSARLRSPLVIWAADRPAVRLASLLGVLAVRRHLVPPQRPAARLVHRADPNRGGGLVSRQVIATM
jgi:hypothetical protein